MHSPLLNNKLHFPRSCLYFGHSDLFTQIFWTFSFRWFSTFSMFSTFVNSFFVSGHLLHHVCWWVSLSLPAGWLACVLDGRFSFRCWFLQIEMFLPWHSPALLHFCYWAIPRIQYTPYMSTAPTLKSYSQV